MHPTSHISLCSCLSYQNEKVHKTGPIDFNWTVDRDMQPHQEYVRKENFLYLLLLCCLLPISNQFSHDNDWMISRLTVEIMKKGFQYMISAQINIQHINERPK